MRVDTIAAIQSYIAQNVAWDGDPASVTSKTPLFDEGVLDSTALFALIGFLEDEYGLEIDDEEIVFNNFETIESIARLVDVKRSAGQTG